MAAIAGGWSRSSAHPIPRALESKAELDEAERLAATVVKLYRAGRFKKAVSPARRSLLLREKALGPMHQEVADGLNSFASVYYAQGAYWKAELLLVRALNIQKKLLGPTHPKVAETLRSLASVYQAQGLYAKAKPLYVRALDIGEKVLGRMHPNVAATLSGLASLLRAQGIYDKAESFELRALDIREKALSSTQPDVADSLSNLGGIYMDQGRYGKAENLYVRALHLSEGALGAMHPDVGTRLNNLGRLYQSQGRYAKAESLYVRALGISEKAVGVLHPNTATSLHNLASLLVEAKAAYKQAEQMYSRALLIRETVLGPSHWQVAETRNEFGVLCTYTGAYSKAQALLSEALDIRERTFGANHPAVAQSLNDLAALYLEQGVYGDAEPLLIRALAIRESGLGVMHADVAETLDNLAILYTELGADHAAEPLALRAASIWEEALGPMHPQVARASLSLGFSYELKGDSKRAESLYVRALSIYRNALGPMHPDVASTMNILGVFYISRRDHARATQFLADALSTFERVYGLRHLYVARALFNLGVVYQAQGEYAKAERLYWLALSRSKGIVRSSYPYRARVFMNLARVYAVQNRTKRVVSFLERAIRVRDRQLDRELQLLTETRMRALMVHLREETDTIASLSAEQMKDDSQAVGLAFTAVLQRKGRILDSLLVGRLALRAHPTPSLRARLQELDAARATLGKYSYAPSQPRTAQRLAAVATARARVEELESALIAVSRAQVPKQPVTIANIQAKLPRRAALVEFLRYRHLDTRSARKRWREDRYIAYVLASSGAPRLMDLGPAAVIDAEIDGALAAMKPGVGIQAARAQLRRLDALVFAPVRSQIGDVRHFIVAPDSKLNLVPFEALVDLGGHYAVESLLVSYVTTGRDLLRFGALHRRRSSAVIVAGPDYGPEFASKTSGRASFSPLTGALGEAFDLQRYFPVSPLTGARATKSALKELTGPAVLHVATHGFYAQGSGATRRTAMSAERAQIDHQRDMFVEESASSPSPPEPEDPIDALDRSGLALAGANGGSDGIMTAREIAGLDLRGTQLVVLSACETGVGAVPSGDGVYGLRRALVLAGAESEVVSLWNVSDSTTRELMRDFYDGLARGTGRAEALRQAKLRLMRRPGVAHPYYWAVFIAAGDWRPLEKGTIRR